MASGRASGAGSAHVAGAILLALSAWPALGQDASVPPELLGVWVGRAVEAEPPLGEYGIPARLTIESDGKGFDLEGVIGNLPPIDIAMAPTVQPGVFGPVTGGGMLSMFRADDPPDPLKGEQLYWARVADHGLVFYAFHIDDDGSFTLDRFAVTREGEELALRATRRTGVADEHVLLARFTKAP